MTDPDDPADGRKFSRDEVAAMFRVDPKTVNRWARTGMLTSIRATDGTRSYHAGEVEELLRNGRSELLGGP
jgi:DNA-binding transcriptional MerR regulator